MTDTPRNLQFSVVGAASEVLLTGGDRFLLVQFNIVTYFGLNIQDRTSYSEGYVLCGFVLFIDVIRKDDLMSWAISVSVYE